MNKKKIGILVTSNSFGGIAKLSAMMANDLSKQNNIVNIYIPILPYYTFYIKIFKKPFIWIRLFFIRYLKKYFFYKKFCFEHILIKKNIDSGLINIKFIFTTIKKNELDRLDCLILNGIGDIKEYQDSQIKKKIYLVNQIEEIYSKKQKKIYEKLRKNFKGDVVTHCNFMQMKLSNQVKNIRVVPNPISHGIWKYRNKININKKRNDILVYIKNDRIYDDAYNFLKKINELSDKLKITIIAREDNGSEKAKLLSKNINAKLFLDLNENSLARLYLNHSFLLYPNRYEDFGMPPVEALACGCVPILNPKTGAASMYSKNNFNSIHLTYNTLFDVKNVLDKLENKNKLLQLRKNSNINLDQFNPDNYGIKIIN